MSNKTCFVVMPIRKPGTPEHSQFRAVFNNIKPVVEKAGFTAIRADDIQKSGAITKDIVTRLGESDLVIADMTDLNPNVFYELGVRHALRGVGTLMVLDEKRTPEIPFDLSAYRVIKYTGDLVGIDALTQALSQFLDSAAESESSHRDNPVHDWFPTLPVNVLENSAQSSEAPLRKTIKQLQERLSAYEKAYGSELPGSKSGTSPLSAVLAALADAEVGYLPVNVMDAARKAFESRNVVEFLQKVRVVLERGIRLPSTMFLTLASWASVMDMDDVVKAIFDQALELYPFNENLKHRYFVALAHSDSPADRERARRDIAQELTIDISQESFENVSPEKVREQMDMLVMLLDAYDRDGMYKDELALAKKLVEATPDSTQAMRNHARALSNTGDDESALQYHRESIFCPDVDDTSAVWLGNELHNRRRHRDAAEAYAFGCLLDPSDAKNFAHLADELSILIAKQSLPFATEQDSQNVPGGVNSDSVLQLARSSLSCPNMDAETSERLRRALERLELGVRGDQGEPMSRAERLECVKNLYSRLRTAMTSKGETYDFSAQQSFAGDA